uniref:Uncharacterized protein n=1 Tax=Anguilla anguilla TaxID=7936 RepID=A0A0E9VTN6_ANGAN
MSIFDFPSARSDAS